LQKVGRIFINLVGVRFGLSEEGEDVGEKKDKVQQVKPTPIPEGEDVKIGIGQAILEEGKQETDYLLLSIIIERNGQQYLHGTTVPIPKVTHIIKP
jgi:hypothetical protein